MKNPLPAPLEGDLDFIAGRIYKSGNPSLAISVPGKSSRDFVFPVEIPADAPDNQVVDLKATFRRKNSSAPWVWRTLARIHQPFTWNISPVLDFPLREDQSFPILHPTLINLNLPGKATIHVKVKNGLDRQQVVSVDCEGPDLTFEPPISHLVLPPNGEAKAEIRLAPTKGTGAYRFKLVLQSGSYQVNDDAVLAAVKEGEALAYTVDYDRDGFDDVILENARVRLFVSPHAGGRAFGFVIKDSNSNAFDCVGGMRDTFTTRIEPDDMKGLPEWTRADWMGLANRPYALKIVAAAGPQAEARLDYVAPDIYPKGIRLERVLRMSGERDAVIEETRLTPFGIGKPQAYVLETSVPFRAFNEANYNDWFEQGRSEAAFVPSKVATVPGPFAYLGTTNTREGQTFAMIPLTTPAQTQLVVERHSALIRFVYPNFGKENESQTYRVAYYLGKKAAAEDIQAVASELRAMK